MAEYVGLTLTVLDIFLRGAKTTYEIIQKDRNMKAFAQQYRDALYENDWIDLQLVCNQAKSVVLNQNISAENKEWLEAAFEEAKGSLDAVYGMAVQINSGRPRLWQLQKPKALESKIQAMGVAMSRFRQTVESLRIQAVSESDLFLQPGDFCEVGKNAVQINRYTRLVVGDLSPARSTDHHRGTARFILEAKPYAKLDLETTKADMRILSSKLGAAPKDKCILSLVGFRKDPVWLQFQLVFRVPSGESTFQTLEDIYRLEPAKPSLNQRLALCGELAQAVLHTHTLGLVHKHIRPGNVLLEISQTPDGKPTLFRSGSSKPALFLSGWQYARTVDDRASSRGGENLVERAVYQHPDRQGLHADASYCMGHDIYSLGVCMLELLTWSPLVRQPGADEGQAGHRHATLSQAYRDAFTQVQGDGQSPNAPPEELQLWQEPPVVQKTIMRINQVLVPVAAGDRMKEVIETCLTCLDSTADEKQFMTPEGMNNKGAVTKFVDGVLSDIARAISVL